jgi:hypothetical protein
MKTLSQCSIVLTVLTIQLFASCGGNPGEQQPSTAAEATVPSNASTSADTSSVHEPQAMFFEQIRSMCGARFEGQSSFPDDPEDSFYGVPLVAVVESCEEQEIRIPFHVGKDTSRTWILTRTPAGLELKHDHRHEDGTPDEITMYGGTATEPGTATSQSFPADNDTAGLIPEAATNEWFLTLTNEGRTLTYYLERHSAPRFKATLQRIE